MSGAKVISIADFKRERRERMKIARKKSCAATRKAFLMAEATTRSSRRLEPSAFFWGLPGFWFRSTRRCGKAQAGAGLQYGQVTSSPVLC